MTIIIREVTALYGDHYRQFPLLQCWMLMHDATCYLEWLMHDATCYLE